MGGENRWLRPIGTSPTDDDHLEWDPQRCIRGLDLQLTTIRLEHMPYNLTTFA